MSKKIYDVIIVGAGNAAFTAAYAARERANDFRGLERKGPKACPGVNVVFPHLVKWFGSISAVARPPQRQQYGRG